MNGHPCQAIVAMDNSDCYGSRLPRTCGKTDPDKPMCFRSEPWCSDQHRKLVEQQRDRRP
jgi:hypothetical protein